MLKVLCLLLVVFVSGTASAYTFDVGIVPVPGACIVSDYPNRAVMPWQGQTKSLLSRDGTQTLSVLVLPSRLEDSLSPTEQRALQQCVFASARLLTSGETSFSGTEVEERLASRINACLKQSPTDMVVRFASIRKGPILCPEGMPK